MRGTRFAISLSLLLAACGGGGDNTTTKPQSASLEITITGPSDLVAAVHVTGPNNYSQYLTTTTTLSNIAQGQYTVACDSAVNHGDTYRPPVDTLLITVPANGQVTQRTVAYRLNTGHLAFVVTGLPTGVPASVNVTVQTQTGNRTVTVSGTDTVTNLPAGLVYAHANIVAQGTTTYGGLHLRTGSANYAYSISASLTPGIDTINYSAMTGSITVRVPAPPAGFTPNALMTGPFGFSRSFTTVDTTVLGSLPLGTYSFTGTTKVSTATEDYLSALPFTVGLDADDRIYDVGIIYTLATGSITANLTGLPGGTGAQVTVTGPDAVPHALSSGATLYKLYPGSYVITTTNVTHAGALYLPDRLALSLDLDPSLTPLVATFAYTPFDLSIDGMYITQASQTYAGTVPLVAGRDGYLRVFVKANLFYGATPSVRVRWYSNGLLVHTDTIAAPSPSVPLLIAEGLLTSSWNLAVPKSLIQQPNLSVLADVDPSGAVPEADRTNNSFPVNGIPLALDVRQASVFQVMAVPVKQRGNSLTGRVTSGNVDTFLSLVQKIHPIPSYQASVHAVYTTADTLSLVPSEFNGEWENVLDEMAALRVAEGAPDSLYYYGVVNTGYTSGVVGIGFIGAPAAVGWDGAIVDQIAAHEIGHNWGRLHSPCGGPADPDPNWPSDADHSNAKIGAYGFDLTTNHLIDKSSYSDIMSYCQFQQWTSDYTYRGVMDFRASSPLVVGSARSASPEPSLLVWGRMHGNEMVLEPAFEITTRPVVPTGSGTYTIEGLDAGGGSVFRYAFDAHEIADLPHGGRAFAFAIPLASFDRTRLAALRLAGRGREVRIDGGAAAAAMQRGAAPASRLSARALGQGNIDVRWDGASYSMALIRDARTGQVLSFARGGAARIAAPGTDLVVTVSNGVRSTTETVHAQ